MACCELRADLPPSQPRVFAYGGMAVAQDTREGAHTLDLCHKETSRSKVSLRSETEIKAGMMQTRISPAVGLDGGAQGLRLEVRATPRAGSMFPRSRDIEADLLPRRRHPEEGAVMYALVEVGPCHCEGVIPDESFE